MPRAGRRGRQHRLVSSERFPCADVMREGMRKVDTPLVTGVRRLGERSIEYRSEAGQFGTTGADLRWIGGEVLADDDRRVGVLERRRACQ